MMEKLLNFLIKILPLFLAYWQGKTKAKLEKEEENNEKIEADINFADSTSNDDFIKLLAKQKK